MKFIRIVKKSSIMPVNAMFGDCSWCSHSIIYHTPGLGCMKCNCEEFH